jgi:hypothetical protein
MTKSPLFWFALGAAAYWGVQHFSGVGKTGKPKPGN